MHLKNKLELLLEHLYIRTGYPKDENILRIKKALKYLNLDFQNTFKVHVVGTNGKGSTAIFLAKLFERKYKKVGLFTSPHYIDFSERIQVNSKQIGAKKLYPILTSLLYDGFFQAYSFFELTFLTALIYFKAQKCDCLVIEAGIGAKNDVTNCFKYKASFLTNIGLDHTEMLGSSLADIFQEKIATLKDHQLFFTNDSTFFEEIKQIGETNRSPVFLTDFNKFDITKENQVTYDKTCAFKTNFNEGFLKQNLALVLTYFLNFTDISVKKIQKTLKKTKIPFRFAKLKSNIVVDGAHNPAAISQIIPEIKKLKKPCVVLSILKPKDHAGIFELFLKEKIEVKYLDFPDIRSYSFSEIKNPNIKYLNSLSELDMNGNNTYIFTGSIHFVGYIVSELKKNRVLKLKNSQLRTLYA